MRDSEALLGKVGSQTPITTAHFSLVPFLVYLNLCFDSAVCLFFSPREAIRFFCPFFLCFWGGLG